jgi:hypothetical protein
MNLQKHSKIRLKGPKLAALNKAIHERDGDCCILCGRYVDLGVKFHHCPQGADKQDRIECGVVLCDYCHHDIHFGEMLQTLKRQVKDYLKNLYPEYWS